MTRSDYQHVPGLQHHGGDNIVAVELDGGSAIRLYFRHGPDVSHESHPFHPWLIVTEEGANRIRFAAERLRLAGDGELRILLRFRSVAEWRDGYRSARELNLPCLTFPSPVEQYLVSSGLSLFRSMTFEQLVRAQIDIETLGLIPDPDENRIIIAVASINGRDPVVFHERELGEAGVIQALTDWIQSTDPDIIEGHNLYNFDLPFLASRARRYGLELTWGRDGSAVRFGGRQRFKVAARSIPFDAAYVYGRHFVDTYQQIQRYDTAGRLNSYGLKPAIDELGLGRSDRTFVDGDAIAATWQSDPERLLRYAIDDVLDTNTLSELTLPTEFYQTQILPSTLQAVATGGPGEKVNDLLVRAYVQAGESIPLPRQPRSYPGGYTAVRAVGIFGPPVLNADLESLYPSIMLRDEISPRSDRLGVFLPMLRTLTDRRLFAKRKAESTSGHEQARWQGIQSSLKVLINSFYGYLGYSRGYFNDFDAAERVTLRGHELIQQVERSLRRRGAKVIEIDTDGIYFVPPAGHDADGARLVESINAELGEGFSLALGGRWERMLSLKLKTYALLDSSGRLTTKGSALRSRRDEPFLRAFLEQAIRALLDPSTSRTVREIYLEAAERILRGELRALEISRTETITENTFSSEANRRLARVAGSERIGERISVYQRNDGSLARTADYAGDEDRAYLLRRLRSFAERFRPLYDSDADFDYDFPIITLHSDIDSLRGASPAHQARLFD